MGRGDAGNGGMPTKPPFDIAALPTGYGPWLAALKSRISASRTRAVSAASRELKIDDFKPEYVGKMQFYLAALDGHVKTDLDGPSIGLILCRSKNAVVVEYALRDARKPVGVSEYRVSLPKDIAGVLPTVQELEQVMQAARPAPASPSVEPER